MKTELKPYIRLGIVAFFVVVISYYSIVNGLVASLFDAILPLIIGAVIAYIINILMSFYERRFFSKKEKSKARRPLSLLFAVFTIILIFVLVGLLVIPQFVSCIRTLIEKAPKAVDQLLSIPQIANLIPDNIGERLANLNWNEVFTQVKDLLQSGLSGAAKSISETLSSTISGVTSFVFGILFAAYFLIDRDRITGQIGRLIKSAFSPAFYEKISHVASVVNDSFHKYIVAQCLEAMILGSLCAIGMLILRLPFALMIGALIALTALIPIVGAYIGASVGAFMILSESPKKAIIFLIFLVILQAVEGNLISPRVVGSSVGLPAVWVLAAVTVGGSMFGIIGMLGGVPLASALYRLLREYTREHSKKLKEQKTE